MCKTVASVLKVLNFIEEKSPDIHHRNSAIEILTLDWSFEGMLPLGFRGSRTMIYHEVRVQ